MLDHWTLATKHALVAAHLLAFLVSLSAACSASRRILSALALLLSVDGARLRSWIVRRVQVTRIAVRVSSCVRVLVLDLLVHGFLPLVRGAAVAAADVAFSILA